MGTPPGTSVAELVDQFARADRLSAELAAEPFVSLRAVGARAMRDRVAAEVADRAGPGVLLARRGKVYITSAAGPRLAVATWRDLDDEEYRESVVTPLSAATRIARGEPIEDQEARSLYELALLNTDAMPEEVGPMLHGLKGTHPPADLAALFALLDQSLKAHRDRHGAPDAASLSQAWRLPGSEALESEMLEWLTA